MELTSDQKKNLILAVKAFRSSKQQAEAAQKNVALKLEKLKECCQGSGSEQQILATAYELLANAHIDQPESFD